MVLFYCLVEVVRSKPYLVSGFPRDTRVHVGENASIVCYDYFSTKVALITDFRWFKWENKPSKDSEEELTRSMLRHGNITEGITLISARYYKSVAENQNSTVLHGVRLNLYNVTKADEGYYSCVGCNNLGCSIRSARFTVTEETGTSHLFCTSLFCTIVSFRCSLYFIVSLLFDCVVTYHIYLALSCSCIVLLCFHSIFVIVLLFIRLLLFLYLHCCLINVLPKFCFALD